MQSAFVKMMRFYKTRDRANLSAAMSQFAGLSSADDVVVRAKSELGTAEAYFLMGNPVEAQKRYKAVIQGYADQPYIKGIALY